MNSLLLPLILCCTVAASVGFGILTAYIAVTAILASFGRPTLPEPVRPRLLLVPSQSPVSGD